MVSRIYIFIFSQLASLFNFKIISEQFFFISDAVLSFPDEIKPFKTIKFDKILQISAKDQPDDVKRVKTVVRELLDINEEFSNDVQCHPLKDLKEQLRERGPVLM